MTLFVSNFTPRALERVHLAVDRRPRQPEGRDAVTQDAADDVERLVDGHVGALAGEVPRTGEAAGPEPTMATRPSFPAFAGAWTSGTGAWSPTNRSSGRWRRAPSSPSRDALDLTLRLLRADAPQTEGKRFVS